MPFQLKDKLLLLTTALPNGAATTVSSGIDIRPVSTKDDLVAPCDFEVVIPALTTGQLADTQTITYSVEIDDDVAFGSPTVYISSLAVQTGAGGAGAAGVTRRFALPSTSERYVRVKAVKTGASNASTASMTFQPVF